MAPRRLLQDPDDLALARAVAPAPGLDRPAGEPVRDGLEHRLHLTRQAGQDDDVLDHEAGRASERVHERLGPAGQTRPARGVVAEAARLEPGAEDGRHLGDLLALAGRTPRRLLRA